MTEQEQQISIQDLQLSLQVYELQSEQKLKKLEEMFKEKGHLQIAKVFYEERSSLQIKFQNIISDLIEFLVKQEVATTQKLRKTFYRLLESPFLHIFKVSRFQIFDLRLDGFDIELEPIEAINELANSLYVNIDQFHSLSEKLGVVNEGTVGYISYDHFLKQAVVSCMRDKIFVLYSYLRKGGAILKKKFENKVKIVEIFNNIQQKVVRDLVGAKDWKTLKEMSILNYEIYMLQNSFDVLCFYLRIPFRKGGQQIFKELETLGEKAKQTSNYDLFINSFLRHHQQIIMKLNEEGIDKELYHYIENVLICVLQLWGCRLCHYKEFTTLFEQLLSLYIPRQEILEKCLKHIPKLQKEDVVLMRTNFKIQLEKKHPELLMLLHEQTIKQTNDFLNQLFHRIAYNLDFKNIPKQTIDRLLTALNGTPSLQEFFRVVEKAIKEWNYTIDFSHTNKFIPGQFKYPLIPQSKIEQSYQIITNCCVLSTKGFDSDFQPLLKSSFFSKFLFQFIKFFSSHQKTSNLFTKPNVQELIAATLQFFVNHASHQEKQPIYLLYSEIINKINQNTIKEHCMLNIEKNCLKNVQYFYLSNLVKIFKNLGTGSCHRLINTMMIQIDQINQKVKKFKFLNRESDSIKILSESQAKFLKDDCKIKNGKIEAKRLQIFKLSDLQLTTNPVQFEKVMDNYYFSLENNSKKFIQFIAQQWVLDDHPFYQDCLSILITEYPVCLPILLSTRVNISNIEDAQTTRFIEIACDLVGNRIKAEEIVKYIIECQSIRYRNGISYVKEEIIPIIIKGLVKKLNNTSTTNVTCLIQVLSRAVTYSNISNLKLDLIVKVIQKIKWLLKLESSASLANRLSFCHFSLLKSFFIKKQMQMRRPNLSSQIDKLIWTEVRQYSKGENQNLNGDKNQPSIINDQIVCSPYSLPRDYTIEQVKLIKTTERKINKEQNKLIEFKQIVSLIEIEKEFQSKQIQILNTQDWRKLDFTKVNYNLRFHLGCQNIYELEIKEKIKIIQKKDESTESLSKPNQEQNLNLIKYYLKQLEHPQISEALLFSHLESLLTTNQQISYLWSNPRNVEKLLVQLMRIYSFTGSKKPFPQLEDQKVNNILKVLDKDRIGSLKKILRFFTKIGYTDLWGQSHSNFPQQYFKDILPLEENSTESFLSSLLKVSLELKQLKQQLNLFLQSLFRTRQSGQNALIYKVQIDRHLLNLIMKSLEIDKLNELSFFIHSNFNNLRLYTDQLHEGLKALNISSKNRSYNQFIQLSKQYQDEEFYGPLKLFKENFKFFIRIEKDGYQFKKTEEKKLTLERLSNIIRVETDKSKLQEAINKIMGEYLEQINKIQLNIANRVKSFYLVTKLRDLSNQNSITINILYSILKNQLRLDADTILKEIQKIEVFSLMNNLFNDLIWLDYSWLDHNYYNKYNIQEKQCLKKNLTLCSTRRFSHSMSKTYEQVDLEIDEVMQRCFDTMKNFFISTEGQIWIQKHNIYVPFLVRSFIPDGGKVQELTKMIKGCLNKKDKLQKAQQFLIQVSEEEMLKDILKGMREVSNSNFYKKNIKIKYLNQNIKIEEFIQPLVKKLIDNQTIVKLENGFLLFNKYKASEPTLEGIQSLGSIIGYCIYHQININISFHPSIVSALSFNIANLDDLCDIDFKAWEELKNVMNIAQSKNLQLNFSRNFQCIDTLTEKRVQLIKMGASKKVNNLNRQQYADLVCCYLMYGNYDKQIKRLLESILVKVPRQLISCMPIKIILSLFYPSEKVQKVIRPIMNKVGLILPEIMWENGVRINNLKDYQNINWLVESLFEQPLLQKKFWPYETNLFVVTTLGAKPLLHVQANTVIIHHFNSKEELKKALVDYK